MEISHPSLRTTVASWFGFLKELPIRFATARKLTLAFSPFISVHRNLSIKLNPFTVSSSGKQHHCYTAIHYINIYHVLCNDGWRSGPSPPTTSSRKSDNHIHYRWPTMAFLWQIRNNSGSMLVHVWIYLCTWMMFNISTQFFTWNFWKWGLLFFPDVPMTYRKSGVSTKGTHSLLIPMKLL